MKKAPDFNLQDQDGVARTLSDYAGQWVVLYFYPRDDTPACTAEACGFRDWAGEFAEAGVTIIGMSKDSITSHKKFAIKNNLTFTLLSDPDYDTIAAYGAWQEKSMFGKKYMGIARMTVVINPEGEIVKEYPKVTPVGHATQILNDLSGLHG